MLRDSEANLDANCPDYESHIEIPKGWKILLDVPFCSYQQPVSMGFNQKCDCIPKLGRLTIRGDFRFADDGGDKALEADSIVVFGLFQVGTENQPFQSQANIRIHGSSASNQIIATETTNLGSKVIAVLDRYIRLHGSLIATTMAKLAKTASAGDTYVQVDRPVDWAVGNTITLAATGADVYELEKAIVKQVLAGNVIVLEAALLYTHTVSLTQLPDGTEAIFAGDAGLMSGRSIVVEGVMPTDPNDIDAGFGFHMVATHYLWYEKVGTSTYHRSESSGAIDASKMWSLKIVGKKNLNTHVFCSSIRLQIINTTNRRISLAT